MSNSIWTIYKFIYEHKITEVQVLYEHKRGAEKNGESPGKTTTQKERSLLLLGCTLYIDIQGCLEVHHCWNYLLQAG